MFGKILIEIAIYFAVCATSCSPCYCLFHSLEGCHSYFHTWFDIGAYFKFPVALRIIGKTASLLGTRNRKCNWNHKLSDVEEWGIFFIKFHILCVCWMNGPFLFSRSSYPRIIWRKRTAAAGINRYV